MTKLAATLSLLFIFNLKLFASSLSLESPAFGLNTMIPNLFTCSGEDKSPPLVWDNTPAHTQSLTLILSDPDAPGGVWVHWVVFNISADLHELKEGTTLPEGASFGKNSWGNARYQGPCPPQGAHRYVFTLYAVNKKLGLKADANPNAVLDAMTGYVLDSAQWAGLYQK